MALLEEKLRLFMETGELNRDKLRGTIGYMSPELILCGYCCKGTDVFAAGKALVTFLCGVLFLFVSTVLCYPLLFFICPLKHCVAYVHVNRECSDSYVLYANHVFVLN